MPRSTFMVHFIYSITIRYIFQNINHQKQFERKSKFLKIKEYFKLSSQRKCTDYLTVQLHSVTSLETAYSLANGPSYIAEGEVCILRYPAIAASPISLLSMGRV